MPTVAATPRSDLVAQVRQLRSDVVPYGRLVQSENDYFLGALDRYSGGTVGDIAASALQQHAQAQRGCLAGGFLMLGSIFLGAAGASGLAAGALASETAAAFGIGGGIGVAVGLGMGLGSSRQVEDTQRFLADLGDWAGTMGSRPPAKTPQPGP